MKILTFIWEYRYELLLLSTILIYGKALYRIFIFDPIAGGNGKVQMDEIAKVVLLYIAIRAERAESRGPEQVYPEMFWVSVLGAIALIAGLKHHYNYVSNNQKSNSDSHSGRPIGSSRDASAVREDEETC